MGLAAAAAAVLLTACSGGGSHASPQAATNPAGSGTSASVARKATLAITIPPKIPVAGAQRRVKYVSPSVSSGVAVVNGVTSYFDLASGSSNCAGSVPGGRSCLIVVPAKIGSNSVALTLYDGAYTGTGPSGNALSAASGFNFSVSEGQQNVTVPLVLGGVPASFSLTAVGSPTFASTSDASFTVTAKDAQGNTIVAPGVFVDAAGNSVSFTFSPYIDPISADGGATTASSVALSNASQQITVISHSGPIVGEELAVTVPASVIGAEPTTYAASPYAATDFDAIALPAGTTLTKIQSAVQGLIGGIGTNAGSPILFSYDTNSSPQAAICIPAQTQLDAVAETNNQVDSAFGSSVVAYSGLGPTAVACNPGIVTTGSGYPETVSYSSLGLVTVQTSSPVPGQCSAVVGSSVSATAILPPFTCNAAQDITTESSSFAPDPSLTAFEWQYSSTDQLGTFNSSLNATYTFVFPSLSLSSGNNTVGGVAVRNGLMWTYDNGSSTALTPGTPNIYSIVPGAIAINPTSALPLSAANAQACILPSDQYGRTFSIGEDGYGYIALGGTSCPTPGLLRVNLQTGAQVSIIDPGVRIVSVASDRIGHVYFVDATGNFYRYPSTTSK